ncbi:CRE-SRG-25 protein [Caenorhabditis remanei]|uniref:Serpentine receptor class gamma n=1 Tax=Caenorhabditis remanei TaxID=31234 RepID=E3LP61_CAERE|nr:CRE-SRG-25 protein [Caenorhabditis remanei]
MLLFIFISFIMTKYYPEYLEEMEELQDPSIRTCEYQDRTVVTQTIMYILQLAYALPISILYLFVILKILKAHKSEQMFSDAYFKIYVLDGVVSLIVVVLDFGLTRPLIYVNPLCYVFWNWFPKPTYILTPYLFGFNYFQFAKIFSISLLSANRFTCVAYPIWHKLFWKKHTNHVIIVSMICPVLFTWQLAISPTRLDIYVGEALLGYEKVVPFVRTTLFKLVVSFAAFLFILLTNIKTYRLTKKFKNKLKNLERSLTLSTVVISAVFIIYIIIQAILLIFSTSFLVENLAFGSILKKIEFICNDFYLMSSPIVLLIMNKRLRSSLFKISPEVPQNTSNTRQSSKNGDTVKIIVKSPSAKTLTMW